MLTLATGAVCCWDASPAYESSSTSGSDSYAASPAICPEYISGDRSPHTPAPHALTGFIFLARVHVPHSSRRCRHRRMGAATSAPAVSRALEDAIEALGGEHSKDVSELVDVFERTEGRKEDTGPAGVDLGTSARDIADSSRRRLKDATELGDVFELPDAVAAALFHRILAVNSTRLGRRRYKYGRRRCRRLFTRRDLPRGLRRLPRRVQDETGRGARGGRRLIPARLYPRRPREGRDGRRRRRRRRRAGPVLGDVIETPRPIRDETNKKVSGARRGRPNPSPPVHPRAPRARPVRSQRRRSLSHPHARGCVAVGRDVTTRAPTRVDASVLQRRRRRKIVRHLLRSGHRVERAYAGVRQDTRRVCSRRVRLGG